LKSPRFGNSCPGELKHDEFENPPTHRRRVGVVRHFPYTGRGRSVAEDRRSRLFGLLLNASQQNPTQICQPVFCNFAARPPILPKHHFFELAESYAEDLRTFVRNHEQLRLRIPVNDPTVTADLDTQEEYAHWHSSAGLLGRR
jgi:hypothetical protein